MSKDAKGRFVSSRPATATDPTAGTPIDADPAPPQWTREELLKVKDLGPAIIGRAMFEAAQALLADTAEGTLGPAITTHDDPRYFQGYRPPA